MNVVCWVEILPCGTSLSSKIKYTIDQRTAGWIGQTIANKTSDQTVTKSSAETDRNTRVCFSFSQRINTDTTLTFFRKILMYNRCIGSTMLVQYSVWSCRPCGMRCQWHCIFLLGGPGSNKWYFIFLCFVSRSSSLQGVAAVTKLQQRL